MGAGFVLPAALQGRYELVRPLGKGGMGAVLLCRDRELDRMVAVKLLARAGSTDHQERFRVEAELLAGLKHRNLVRLLDHGVVEGSPYLVLEYLDGPSLDQAGGDPLPPMLEVADALDELHRAGCLHRDVKPTNIVLVPDRGAVLIDFGLASLEGGTGLTRTGEVAGTPAYLAPEMLEGRKAVPASDYWAWGVTLYHLAERRVPFPPGAIPEYLVHGTLPAVAFSAIDPEGPVGRVVRACLELDPAARPSSRRQVDALLAGRPLPTTRSRGSQGKARIDRPGPSGGSRPGGRSRALVPGLVLVGVLGLGLGLSTVREEAARGTGDVPEAGAPAARWVELARGVEAGALVARLHAAAYPPLPGGSGLEYQERIWKMREGQLDAGEGRRELARRALELPLRVELAQDRAALARWLGDPGVPFAARAELFAALEPFGEIDAYYECWGLEPPYGAGGLRGALIPIVERVVDTREPLERAPPESEPARPGRRVLFAWERGHDTRFPWLVVDPENPNALEKVGWTHPWMQSGGLYDIRKHRRIDAGLVFEGEPTRTFRRAVAWCTTTNLERPNALVLEWNDLQIPIRPLEGIPTRGFYHHSVKPSVAVEVGLPVEGFRPGRNRLALWYRPVAGLPHAQGVDVNGLGITLEGR